MRRLFLLALLGAASPALSHHPADRIDEAMAEREPTFEAIEGALPKLPLVTDDGRRIDLREQSDRILVLSFVPEGCGVPCAGQQQALAGVQRRINGTPMRELVSFVTVAAPGASVSDGWDTQNWQHAVPAGDESSTKLSADMAERSQRAGGPMAFIIDRGTRPRAIFHGAEFGQVNMVLYINSLSNAPMPKPTFIERLSGWLP